MAVELVYKRFFLDSMSNNNINPKQLLEALKFASDVEHFKNQKTSIQCVAYFERIKNTPDYFTTLLALFNVFVNTPNHSMFNGMTKDDRLVMLQQVSIQMKNFVTGRSLDFLKDKIPSLMNSVKGLMNPKLIEQNKLNQIRPQMKKLQLAIVKIQEEKQDAEIDGDLTKVEEQKKQIKALLNQMKPQLELSLTFIRGISSIQNVITTTIGYVIKQISVRTQMQIYTLHQMRQTQQKQNNGHVDPQLMQQLISLQKKQPIIEALFTNLGWIGSSPTVELIYKEFFLIDYQKEHDKNYHDYTQFPRLVELILKKNVGRILNSQSISPICFEFLLKVGLMENWNPNQIKNFNIPNQIFISLSSSKIESISNCEASWKIYLRMTQLYVQYSQNHEQTEQTMQKCLKIIFTDKANCSDLLKFRYLYECLNVLLLRGSRLYPNLNKIILSGVNFLVNKFLIPKLNKIPNVRQCNIDPAESFRFLFCLDTKDTKENPVCVIYNIWNVLIKLYPVYMVHQFLGYANQKINQRDSEGNIIPLQPIPRLIQRVKFLDCQKQLLIIHRKQERAKTQIIELKREGTKLHEKIQKDQDDLNNFINEANQRNYNLNQDEKFQNAVQHLKLQKFEFQEIHKKITETIPNKIKHFQSEFDKTPQYEDVSVEPIYEIFRFLSWSINKIVDINGESHFFIPLNILTQIFKFVKYELCYSEHVMMNHCKLIEFLRNFIPYTFSLTKELRSPIHKGLITVMKQLIKLMDGTHFKVTQCFALHCINEFFVDWVGKNPRNYQLYAPTTFCLTFVCSLIEKIEFQMKFVLNRQVLPIVECHLEDGSQQLMIIYSHLLYQFCNIYWKYIPLETHTAIIAKFMNCIHYTNVQQFGRHHINPNLIKPYKSKPLNEMMVDDDNDDHEEEGEEEDEPDVVIENQQMMDMDLSEGKQLFTTVVGNFPNIDFTENLYYFYNSLMLFIPKKFNFKMYEFQNDPKNVQHGLESVTLLNELAYKLCQILLKQFKLIEQSNFQSDITKKIYIIQLLIKLAKESFYYFPHVFKIDCLKKESTQFGLDDQEEELEQEEEEEEEYFEIYKEVEFIDNKYLTPRQKYQQKKQIPNNNFIHIYNIECVRWVHMYTRQLPYWMISRKDWPMIRNRKFQMQASKNFNDDIALAKKRKLHLQMTNRNIFKTASNEFANLMKGNRGALGEFARLCNEIHHQNNNKEINSKMWQLFLQFSKQKGYHFYNNDAEIPNPKFKLSDSNQNQDQSMLQTPTTLVDIARKVAGPTIQTQTSNIQMMGLLQTLNKQKDLQRQFQNGNTNIKDQLIDPKQMQEIINQIQQLRISPKKQGIPKFIQNFVPLFSVEFINCFKTNQIESIVLSYLNLELVFTIEELWTTTSTIYKTIIQHLIPYMKGKKIDLGAEMGIFFLVLFYQKFQMIKFMQVFGNLFNGKVLNFIQFIQHVPLKTWKNKQRANCVLQLLTNICSSHNYNSDIQNQILNFIQQVQKEINNSNIQNQILNFIQYIKRAPLKTWKHKQRENCVLPLLINIGSFYNNNLTKKNQIIKLIQKTKKEMNNLTIQNRIINFLQKAKKEINIHGSSCFGGYSQNEITLLSELDLWNHSSLL